MARYGEMMQILFSPPGISHHRPRQELGYLEGTLRKKLGFTLRYLRISGVLPRNTIIAILNRLHLRDAVYACVNEPEIMRSRDFLRLDLACDFGDDPHVGPAMPMIPPANCLAFSLELFPQLREAPVIQYARTKICPDDTLLVLTIIAGTDGRFAGDMTHIKQMRENRPPPEGMITTYQKHIRELEECWAGVSKENARMRERIAMIANSIEDTLWRPPKRRWWSLGPARKDVLGEAMIRTADELRAVLVHAYSALF